MVKYEIILAINSADFKVQIPQNPSLSAQLSVPILFQSFPSLQHAGMIHNV